MKIVLLNPPSEKGYIRSGRWTRKTRANQNWYPLWLGYATGYLKRAGHECWLIDACTEEKSPLSTIREIENIGPDLIAYYFCYDTVGRDMLFASILYAYVKKRNPLCQMVLVGPWSYCINALKYAQNINLMTYGEFEHTLIEIAEGKEPEKIRGLYWRDENGEIHKNPPRPLHPLKGMPWVTKIYKKFLNLYNYRQTSLKFPFIETQTSRGCPHRCTYCASTRAWQGGPSYRTRPVKEVIEELWHVKQFIPEAKQVFFQDEALPKKRAVELSQAILDEGLKICWGGLARGTLDYETLKLMEEAGCRTLQVGFESCFQEYLDVVHKDVTVEQYEEFCKAINKTKIWNNAAFMIFPWMTREDVEYTVRWAKRMRIDRLSFITAIPYPNTPFAEYVEGLKRKGVRLLSWRESVELEKWAHKRYYLFNPRMWWHVLSHPSKWRDVMVEAEGLLRSFKE